MAIDGPDVKTAMMSALEERDRSQDGQFVFAVKTTGIYCRPSCPAKRPKPGNIAFFATNNDAEAAGFRACKRCRPDEVSRDEAAVKLALDAIRNCDRTPALDELARLAGYSPTHLQRIFKRATGLSPASYSRAIRGERAREALSRESRVGDAIYDAGFEAPSRFYDAVKGKLGMAPSAWVNGGKDVTIRWAVIATSLAPMLVAATDRGICRLSFNRGKDELERLFPHAELIEGGADFAALLERVVAAVETPASGMDIPLDVRGTAFQEAVWRELRKIPAGETRTYAEIAAAAGSPRAVRAAGSANGANNVAVLIPCHRVVRSDGSIGGYAYGERIKAELLKRENKA
jgi:AraC family transcriptional regulator of adaptative response/methylated-DNA-[protein]-cysteine methyltransferase